MTNAKVPTCLLHVNVNPETQIVEVGYYDKTLPVHSETHPPKLLDQGGKIVFHAVREFTSLEEAEEYAHKSNIGNIDPSSIDFLHKSFLDQFVP
jgi:hypothetical protein